VLSQTERLRSVAEHSVSAYLDVGFGGTGLLEITGGSPRPANWACLATMPAQTGRSRSAADLGAIARTHCRQFRHRDVEYHWRQRHHNGNAYLSQPKETERPRSARDMKQGNELYVGYGGTVTLDITGGSASDAAGYLGNNQNGKRNGASHKCGGTE